MILAIVQARMSSTRLPGKVMKPILGEPMLWRQLERIQRCESLDRIVVATSTDPSDNVIEQFCRQRAVDCFRGSLDDVLDRYHKAAIAFGPASHVVRLTADCPLAFSDVIDACIRLHLDKKADYTSNCIHRTFPDGLDVEVMTTEILEVAWREATRPYDREHVTPYINQSRGRFRLASLTQERDLSRLRWTVDTENDFLFVNRVFEHLLPSNAHFGTEQILDALRKKLLSNA
jgi:spore coat polysaccharide biosynthesis protein SpsF